VEGQDATRDPGEVEVSFVMPCLDEAETLGPCIEAARRCIEANELSAEIIIADNGSVDDSAQIAQRGGARVVAVEERGYGAALMGGIESARGRYIVMGDCDLSYDFAEAMPFVDKLRAGDDLVMGSRFAGRILPGAMPWHHRWIGNPVLSAVGRTLFRSSISDFHCGLRAFTKHAYEKMRLRTTGMEFASEMVVKATVRDMQVSEVPIILHPDGRSRAPHLRSWRDGWRHLRFMLLLSPLWTLFVPGLALAVLGTLLTSLLYPGPVTIGGVTFDIHTMIAGSLFLLVGYQMMTVAVAARIYALTEEIGPPAPWLVDAFDVFTLERGLLAGALLTAAGVAVIASTFFIWAGVDFGSLDPRQTIRPMLVGSTCVALGFQTLLMSFVYSMLGIQRSR